MASVLLEKGRHVWKSARMHSRWTNGNPVAVVRLFLPAGTRVNYPLNSRHAKDGGKIRADQARVVSIHVRRSGREIAKAYSDHDRDFVYEVGKTVKPRWRFSRSRYQCASGIHFFLKRERAAEYLS